MGLFDFAKAVAHQVLPGGKTYSSYYADKRKKEEEERNQSFTPTRQSSSAPQVRVTPTQRQPQLSVETDNDVEVEKPKNIFKDLNTNMGFNRPNNALEVMRTEASKPVENPRPGTVVEPEKKDSRNIFERVRDQLSTGDDKTFSNPGTPNSRTDFSRFREDVNKRLADREGDPFRGTKFMLRNFVDPAGTTNIARELVQGVTRIPANIVAESRTRQRRDDIQRDKELLSQYMNMSDEERQRRLARSQEIAQQEANATGRTTYSEMDNSLAPWVIERLEREYGINPLTASQDDFVKAFGRINAEGDFQWNPDNNIVTRNLVGGDPIVGYTQEAEELSQAGEDLTGTKIDPGLLTMALVALDAVPGADDAAKNAAKRELLERIGREGVRDLDDDFIRETVDKVIEETQPRPITVSKDIPVVKPDSLPEPIRVRNLNEPAPVIREVTGDATTVTPDSLTRKIVEDTRRNEAFDFNKVNSPTQREINAFEGVTPQKQEPFRLDPEVAKGSQDDIIDSYATWLKEVGEGNGVSLAQGADGPWSKVRVSNNVRFGDTKGKRMTKQMWRDEAERQLNAGVADPSLQKAFDEAADPEVQSLLKQGEQTPTETPRPIEVKDSKSIPVRDETVVPVKDEGTPGNVRELSQRSPMQEKSEAIANAPVVNSPAKITAETQAILDNPKQYTKRQVQAARNQRKLARQLAKTQEETAEAMSRIDTAKATPRVGDEGFAPTGRFDKGRAGNVYEKASIDAESARAAKNNAQTSADDLISEMSNKVEFSQSDTARINEMRERLMKDSGYRGNPAFQVLDEFYKQSGTQKGQALALFNRYMRRTASGEQLANKWYNKVSKVVDTSNISDADLDAVTRANTKFTQLRDAEVRLEDQFLKTGSEKDFNAWQDAFEKSAKADIDAKTVELNALQRASKGSKNENVAKVLDDLKREADLNMMDPLTASQLSGPATGSRNLVGTELAGVENRLFANTRAKVTNKLFGSNVGGYSRTGARQGRKEGLLKMGDDARRRAVYSSKNPIKHAQNFATTINTGGEASLQSQAKSRLAKYYENMYKGEYSGKDLEMRVKHAMAKDPENMGGTFLDASMKSSGLTGLYPKTQTIEKAMASALEGQLGKAMTPKMANAVSKGLTRLIVGYPTAAGNFVAQSAKRTALGVPTFMETGVKLARGDKQGAAMAFDRALKEAGSGAAMWGAGMALNEAGLISGFYPEDPDERQRWADEGISELSIKIGDSWYPIPTQFGMLGLPILFGATFNESGAEGVVDTFTTRDNLFKLLPADQAYGAFQVLAGDATTNQDKSFVASAIRSLIPAGSFFAQTAKGLDPTANDTTTKDFWSNVFDQVASGIPGVNEAMDIPDKTSSTGEPIQNPNLAQVYSGARSVEQEAGVQNSKEVDARINEQIAKIDEFGLLSDPNLEGILEGTAQEALVKAQSGKQLDESDIKALQKGLVENVSQEGSDTAYLERGQYDTHLGVLKLKKQLMESDKTVAPSKLEKIDTAIKRGEVYKENKLPYSEISDYQDTSLTEWRAMGDPEDEDYNPEMYQRLWEIDQMMTEAGVSYGKELEKNKYYAKDSKSGSGRRGSGQRKLGGEFGKLNASNYGPQVRQYETIQSQTGQIPRIKRTRSNIVHQIKAGG